MFIRYRIEPVGKKYGWSQGDADCWYYTAKSLLRFYGLANKNADQVYAHLQIVKLIRLFKNALRKAHGKNVPDPMKTTAELMKWIDEEISDIQRTRADIVARAREEAPGHKAVQALFQADNWTPNTVAELCLICRDMDALIAETDLTAISAKRVTFLNITKTILTYDAKLKNKTWKTGEIFASAFPKDLFQSVECSERTPEALYKTLQKHGPLWTSGALNANQKFDYSVVTHGDTPSDDVVVSGTLVESYVTDSSHAVVVYGVSTDHGGKVEYADPHNFQTPRRVAASVFFDHLRPIEFQSQNIYFLKVAVANSESVLQSKKINTW